MAQADPVWEEMGRQLGIGGTSAPTTTIDPSWADMGRQLGLVPEKPEEEPVAQEGFLSRVFRSAAAETVPGLAARAAGAWDYEAPELGTAGQITSGLASFVLDPTTYLGGGLGKLVVTKGIPKIIGKEAAEDLLKYGAKKGAGPFAARAARAGVVPGVQLGVLEAARDPFRQYLESGEVNPAMTAWRAAQSTAVGMALGPASQAGRMAIPAEIATLAVADPLLHGREPEWDDVVHGAGAVLGLRLVGKVLSLGADAKARLLEDKKSRSEAGQQDPTPNKETFKDVTGEDASRKQVKAAVELLEKERTHRKADRPPTEAFFDGASKENILTNRGAQALAATEPELAYAVAASSGSRADFRALNLVSQRFKNWTPQERQLFVEHLNAVLRPPMEPGRADRPVVHEAIPASDEAVLAKMLSRQRNREVVYLRRFNTFVEEHPQFNEAQLVPPGEVAKVRQELRKMREFDKPKQEPRKEAADVEAKTEAEAAPEAVLTEPAPRPVARATPPPTNEAPRAARSEPPPNIRAVFETASARGEVFAEHGKRKERVFGITDDGIAAVADAKGNIRGIEVAKIKSLRDASDAAIWSTGEPSPKTPSRLSKRVVNAKAKAEATWKEAERELGGRLSANAFFDPKVVRLLGRAIRYEIEAGVLNFADVIQSAVRRFGAAAVQAGRDVFARQWEAQRSKNKRLDKPGDVDEIIARIEPTPKAFSETTPRPDLANIGVGAQRPIMQTVDAVRSAAGEPARIPDSATIAKAEQRLARDPSGERERLLKGEWFPGSEGVDTEVAKRVWREQASRALRTMEPKDVADAIIMGVNYRDPRSSIARELRMGRDPEMTPAERMANNAGQALFKPKTDVETSIRKAVESGDQAKARELAEGAAKEVAALRQALEARGHNVTAVLEGRADPIAAAGMVREAQSLRSAWNDRLYEYWNNAILSGPATHIVNTTGNIAHGAWYFTAQRMTEAVIDSVLRGVGLKAGGARLGELKYVAQGMMTGWGQAARNFYTTWQTEIPTFYSLRGMGPKSPQEFRSGAIPGTAGRVIRTPWRLLSSADDLIKTQVARTEAMTLAYRQARNEGLSGEALSRRMAQLIADPKSNVQTTATETAIRLAFQETTPLTRAVAGLREAIPGSRYLLPFITTPFNILRTGVRASPFGSLKLAQEAYKASKSGDWARVTPRLAEQVLSWGAVLALAYTNDPEDPWITGGSDRNRPYSVNIGGQWYNYSRIEPFATTMGMVIDGIQQMQAGKDMFEAMKAPLDALLGRIENQTFFTGTSDFMKAMRYQDATYVMEWAGKFPASWVPNLVKMPARAVEPDIQQARIWGVGPERLARTVRRGAESTGFVAAFPRYDLWGRKTPKDGSPIPHTDFVSRTLNPFGQRRYTDTVGDRMIRSWNANNPSERVDVRPPLPYFTHKGERVYMTDAEYDQFVRESGRLSLVKLQARHAAVPFDLAEPTKKEIELLQNIVENSRRKIKASIHRRRLAESANAR